MRPGCSIRAISGMMKELTYGKGAKDYSKAKLI